VLSSPSLTSTMSLDDVLRGRVRLSTKQRLELGIKLASSVMQLHNSGWLAEEWGRKDVFFLLDSEGIATFENPLISWSNSISTTSAEKAERTVVQCNQTLLSLGIILIELYHGKCLEECSDIDSGDRGTAAQKTRHSRAWSLVDLLYDDAGDLYGDVVRRCVRGLDHRESSLDQKGFKLEVFQKVLYPLQTNYSRIFISSG